jgi:hypothetical protein
MRRSAARDRCRTAGLDAARASGHVKRGTGCRPALRRAVWQSSRDGNGDGGPRGRSPAGPVGGHGRSAARIARSPRRNACPGRGVTSHSAAMANQRWATGLGDSSDTMTDCLRIAAAVVPDVVPFPAHGAPGSGRGGSATNGSTRCWQALDAGGRVNHSRTFLDALDCRQSRRFGTACLHRGF